MGSKLHFNTPFTDYEEFITELENEVLDQEAKKIVEKSDVDSSPLSKINLAFSC